MSQTTTPPAAAPSRMARRGAGPLKQVLLALASLRLTVVLFSLSLVLVFCGTLAQRDLSIWAVVDQYFRGSWKTAGFVWIPFKNLVFFSMPGSFPFPGGYLLGGALTINLLAAHAVRFRLTWRRSGVLVLHAGLLLMLIGEFITRQYAIEGNMSIYVNSYSNYLEHRDSPELAVLTSADAHNDDVVVIPTHLLRAGGAIQHPDLPFDVEVLRYMPNSTLSDKPPDGSNPVTAGEGLKWAVNERRPVSGADTDQKVDMPSAHVVLRGKDSKPLGTYLFSTLLTDAGLRYPVPQIVTVDGKDYEVSLRFKRTYKPYTVRLFEFKHDVYEGTDIAKNFSSLVRLEDPSRAVTRQALIYMNNPLRYEGETFYQSEVRGENEGTVLQVVRNPGWLLPYFSCALVALGMLLHFGMVLTNFLRKQLAGPAAVPVLTPAGEGPPPVEEPVLAAVPAPAGSNQITVRAGARPAPSAGRFTGKRRKPTPVVAASASTPATAAGESSFDRAFPWVILVLGFIWLIAAMSSRSDPPEKMQLEEFAGLPVLLNGRTKPIDTVARNSLMAVSDRQTFRDVKDHSQPAVAWLLDVLTSLRPFHNSEIADAQIVRIENDQVLGFLELKPRSGLRYSLTELFPRLKKIDEEARKAERTEEAQRDLFAIKILELARRLHVIMRLMEISEPFMLPPLRDREALTWKELVARARQDDELARRLEVIVRYLKSSEPGTLRRPPADREWWTWPEAVVEASRSGKVDPALLAYTGILDAYARHDTRAFNKAVAEYRAEVDGRMPEASRMAGFELFFNNFEPFYHCALLYVLVFLLGCLSWLFWARPLGRAAYWLAILTFVVHTGALIGRIYLTGRPPVTNLYSSAIFIGWIGVLVCLLLEPLFRLRICTVVAAIAGAVTMLIAHLLARGDTMEQLVAVLDTNFWLATHVVCVTIGYAATYLAGLFGMGYLLYGGLRLLNPALDRSVLKVLSQMTYGVICFATLFSFVGTVLGGIWADQSWGRFWGWDPKENGALLIVIWNALILHARWSGMARERGVALLTVVGNIITSWSWFGTNLLGVGLHNYGFMHGAFWGLLGAVTFFLAWLGAGLALPKRVWH